MAEGSAAGKSAEAADLVAEQVESVQFARPLLVQNQ